MILSFFVNCLPSLRNSHFIYLFIYLFLFIPILTFGLSNSVFFPYTYHFKNYIQFCSKFYVTAFFPLELVLLIELFCQLKEKPPLLYFLPKIVASLRLLLNPSYAIVFLVNVCYQVSDLYLVFYHFVIKLSLSGGLSML